MSMTNIIVKMDGAAADVINGNMRADALLGEYGWFEGTDNHGVRHFIARSSDGVLKAISSEELLLRMHRKTNAGLVSTKQSEPYYREFEKRPLR
jgi:hypothetical protein